VSMATPNPVAHCPNHALYLVGYGPATPMLWGRGAGSSAVKVPLEVALDLLSEAKIIRSARH